MPSWRPKRRYPSGYKAPKMTKKPEIKKREQTGFCNKHNRAILQKPNDTRKPRCLLCALEDKDRRKRNLNRGKPGVSRKPVRKVNP